MNFIYYCNTIYLIICFVLLLQVQGAVGRLSGRSSPAMWCEKLAFAFISRWTAHLG